MSQALILIAVLSVVAIIFALGLSAGATERAWALRNPGALARAALGMFVIMPLVAAAMAVALDLRPAIKVALIALALSPVPPMMPRREIKAGTEATQALGFLVTAALLSIVVTPLGLILIAALFGLEVTVPLPRILLIVTLSIVLPLVAGMLVRRLKPGVAMRLAGPIDKLGLVLLVVAVVPILFKMAPAMWSLVGDGTVVAFVAFLIVGLAVGHFLSGGRSESRTVLALSIAVRHPGIAAAVAGAVTAAEGVRPEAQLFLPAILLYVLIGGIVTTIYLVMERRATPKA
ncbi:MAG: hypothetical protein IT530_09650 [Burkholderiales bacterium]|nr:hypothetical protein [Burkholderiales bacterium]